MEYGHVTNATPESPVNQTLSDFDKYVNSPSTKKYLSNSQPGFSNYSDIAYDLKKVKQNLDIGGSFTNSDTEIKSNLINKFNRFLIAYTDTQLSKTFGHVFFTRPDLNLYTQTSDAYNPVLLDSVDNDPVFYYLHRNEPKLLMSLTNRFSPNHDFNPYLSNLAKNFETKDEAVDVGEFGETFTGYKIKYGRNNIKSKTADSFSIKYREDKDYGIFKLHKAWTEYISKVYRGQLNASDDNIRNRILDYACSVYYFLCGPDGETILFWTKYTGVFPANTPASQSSWTYGDVMNLPEYSIEYQYSWKDDLNPLTLAEFNQNSIKRSMNKKSLNSTYVKTYNPNTLHTGQTFTSCPFIETIEDTVTNEMCFKLRFRNL